MSRHMATSGLNSPRQGNISARVDGGRHRGLQLPNLPSNTVSSQRKLPAITSATPRRRKKKKVAPLAASVNHKLGKPNNNLLQTVSEANSPQGAAGADWDEVDGAVISPDLFAVPTSCDIDPSLPPLFSASPSPTGGGGIEFPLPPPAGYTPRSRHHRGSSGETGPLFEKRKDPLLHHRASAAHRQIIHEVRHQQRQDRLIAEQRKQHLRLMDASCILEEVGENEDDEDYDITPPIPQIPPSSLPVTHENDQTPDFSIEPSDRREKARQRWNIIRDKLEEVHDERTNTQTAKGWNMFVKHVQAMSDMEKARHDLYSRYGVVGRGAGYNGSSSPLLRTFQRLDNSSGGGPRRSARLRYIPEDETPRLNSVNL